MEQVAGQGKDVHSWTLPSIQMLFGREEIFIGKLKTRMLKWKYDIGIFKNHKWAQFYIKLTWC